MEDKRPTAAAETTEVFHQLAEAAKLYEPYRELAVVAKLASEHRPPVPAQPSWDHPLGLVIRSSK